MIDPDNESELMRNLFVYVALIIIINTLADKRPSKLSATHSSGNETSIQQCITHQHTEELERTNVKSDALGMTANCGGAHPLDSDMSVSLQLPPQLIIISRKLIFLNLCFSFQLFLKEK